MKCNQICFSGLQPQGSPTSMIKELRWASQEQRRLMARLIMVYRIQHGLNDIPPHYTTSQLPWSSHDITTNAVQSEAIRSQLLPSNSDSMNRLPASAVTALSQSWSCSLFTSCGDTCSLSCVNAEACLTGMRPQGCGKLANAALLSLINEACVNVCCATLLSCRHDRVTPEAGHVGLVGRDWRRRGY